MSYWMMSSYVLGIGVDAFLDEVVLCTGIGVDALMDEVVLCTGIGVDALLDEVVLRIGERSGCLAG